MHQCQSRGARKTRKLAKSPSHILAGANGKRRNSAEGAQSRGQCTALQRCPLPLCHGARGRAVTSKRFGLAGGIGARELVVKAWCTRSSNRSRTIGIPGRPWYVSSSFSASPLLPLNLNSLRNQDVNSPSAWAHSSSPLLEMNSNWGMNHGQGRPIYAAPGPTGPQRCLVQMFMLIIMKSRDRPRRGVDKEEEEAGE